MEIERKTGQKRVVDGVAGEMTQYERQHRTRSENIVPRNFHRVQLAHARTHAHLAGASDNVPVGALRPGL